LGDQCKLEDWQIVEKLNDLFVGVQDLALTLKQALEIILDSSQYAMGAFYVPARGPGSSGMWIKLRLPSFWANQIQDTYSQLNQLVKNVLSTGVVYSNTHALDLAGIFPIFSVSQQVIGILCVAGPAIPSESYNRWQALLRPVGRIIEAAKWSLHKDDLEQYARKLQVIANSQAKSWDLTLFQQAAMESLRDLFGADDVLLLLANGKDLKLTIGYLLSQSREWFERRGLILDDMRADSFAREDKGVIADPSENPQFFQWLATVLKREVARVLWAPLKVESNFFGLVVMLNPDGEPENALRQGFLTLVTTMLARAIQETREITHLRISLADIEANRLEILNSRNMLRLFFDSLPISVYVVDNQYTLQLINSNRSNRVNKHPSQLVGKKCYEMLYKRNDPCPACRVADTLARGYQNIRNYREWVDQEQFVEWEITTLPINAGKVSLHQVVISEENVTTQRQLEANLVQSEKLAAMGQLAAGVAHEINNPLAAIIANAQILKRELPKDNQDWADSMDLIETAGLRAAQVVSNLLAVARKEKDYEYELFGLNETIQNTLALIHHEILNRSIQVVLDLQEDMPEIFASKNHLQGVWINMIVNSTAAIDKLNGQITIRTRYGIKEFQVMIEDNGKGIPQEQLGLIFEPFFTTKSVGKGTGLGLSVSQRIIKEHGGSIQVESQVGQGTKFTVTLPEVARRI
jgi:signal transduction histidine kinase